MILRFYLRDTDMVELWRDSARCGLVDLLWCLRPEYSCHLTLASGCRLPGRKFLIYCYTTPSKVRVIILHSQSCTMSSPVVGRSALRDGWLLGWITADNAVCLPGMGENYQTWVFRG